MLRVMGCTGVEDTFRSYLVQPEDGGGDLEPEVVFWSLRKWSKLVLLFTWGLKVVCFSLMQT